MIDETFFHYRILDKLGAGGMGEVYLAEDASLNRKVALKFPPADATPSAHSKQRFMREARAAATLRHPNIVHIYEAGEADGTTFIAMEYVEGQTLDKRIGAGPVTTVEIARIALDIADALDEAHRAGITHRDIKPSNIMITPRGQVKVLDFGLAKFIGAGSAADDMEGSTEFRTARGVVVGTVQYMSPEQALGRLVDARSDLFSLGSVIYELTTSRRAFSGATAAETVDRILHDEPEPTGRFNLQAPQELERIIRKCLEKDPDRRYQSARDLVADLRNFQRDIHVPQRRAEEHRSAPRKRLVLIVLALVVLVGIGAGMLWLRKRNTPIDSLAVLPFTNAGADSASEYLSDGITENLIYRLSELADLRVVPRSTVFRYKGRDVAPRLIGRELRVRAVLLGRVTQRRQMLSVSAELVDVENDAQLWGARYERGVADLQGLQDEIISAVAGRVRPKLTDAEQRDLKRHYTRSSAAHLLYLQGRYFWNKRSREGIEKGIDYFRQAIEADPGYSLAYAGLADSYNFLGAFGIAAAPPGETMLKARAAALKALDIDDSLPEAHTSLAFVKLYYDWDWAGAEQEFKRALELDPNYAPAHQWYSHLLMVRGRTSESIAAAKQALELDPLSLAANMNFGWQYHWARKPELAVQHLRRTLELDPAFAQGHWALGLASEQTGRFDAAAAALEKAVDASETDAVYLASLGHAYALGGRMSDAVRLRSELEERSKHAYVPPYWMATLCVGLRENDQAFRWLEKAYEERSGGLVWLGTDPRMDPIRSDPRFRALQQRVESASAISASPSSPPASRF